ncbi:hypothetical protein [Noviherbaspirillum pedocola]|uniref:Uncharacterized protein n=1 Tax=Noviherbaspirillum pedocola TaxID=2801341 RepID=A0A934SVP8_9BURK|nr:hypothetical protein [Noviherbaspirillum pedocola]MBK4736280.1 hypothetical protein [Noviherbaspirillum pedocola]
MRRREFLIRGVALAGAAAGTAHGAEKLADKLVGKPASKPAGPAAPALTADAPHSFEVWDWSNASKPKLAGNVTLDKRIDDFVYEDAEMAAENGAIAVVQSTESAMLGDIEIGFTLLAADRSNTETRDRPLYQVLGAFAHRGSWKTYPASDTFDSKNHITFPRPFKVVMKNAAGKTLHVFQLHDGKPINAPGLNQTRSEKEPLRPKFTVFMMLPWQNTRPRASKNRAKYYAGMTKDGMRPSIAKQHYSVLSCEPLVTGGYGRNSSNGLANIYGAPQWPRPLAVYWPKVQDPYLHNSEFNRNGGSAFGAAWVEGWDYEPGSFSCHNWYTGPGGPRFDRSAIPSVVAIWASDPNGRRLQENVAHRDWLDAWGMAYFNHGNHWVRDVKTMTLMTSRETMTTPWGTVGNYYGGGSIGPRSIRVNGDQRDGTTDANRDRNGDIWGNGWARDALHSYCNAGWMALLLNSPMHAIGSRFDVAVQMMMKGDPRGDVREEYMVRSQAWHWLHYVFAWKLASRHPLGIAREDVEDSFAMHCEAIYRQIYVPQLVEKKDDPYFNGLRNLGQPMTPSGDGSKWVAQGGHLGYYMGHVLQLMKQTGMWSAMMDRGGHVRDALLLQIRNMDHYAFGLHADTTATVADYLSFPAKGEFPKSMAHFQELYGSKDEDMYHDAKGNPVGDRDVSVHAVAQYIYIRRDYFPELPHPKLKAAAAALDRRLASVTARVAAAKDPEQKREADHTYRYPGLAPIRPPGRSQEVG